MDYTKDMNELVGRVEDYNLLCMPMLEDFWGLMLTLPTLEYTQGKLGILSERRISLSDTDFDLYLTRFSQEMDERDAPFIHFSAHTMNHIFTLAQNNKLVDAFVFPTSSRQKTSILEAIIGVPTEWVLNHWHEYQEDQTQYDGHAIVLKYYKVWKDQLEETRKPVSLVDASQQLYEKYRILDRPDFKKLVKDYPSDNHALYEP